MIKSPVGAKGLNAIAVFGWTAYTVLFLMLALPLCLWAHALGWQSLWALGALAGALVGAAAARWLVRQPLGLALLLGLLLGS